MIRIFYILTVMFLILFVSNVAAFAYGLKSGNERKIGRAHV